MKIKYYLQVVFVLLLLTLISCKSGSENTAKNTLNTVIFSDTAITKLPQVCIVNNRFLNSEQIPVPLNGKTYYGCYEGCVNMLNEDSTSHFASDLQVDKAIAFTIGKPGKQGRCSVLQIGNKCLDIFQK